jgi:hypothetical protein
VVSGQLEILHYFGIDVDLEVSAKNVVFVRDNLHEIQQWFAMNIKEDALNVVIMYKKLNKTPVDLSFKCF